MKKMKKKLNITTIILMIIFLTGLIFSCYKIIEWKQSLDINDKIKTKLNKKIKKEKDKVKYNIDFKALKKENSDTVGYIKVNNTNIDYIVVQGKDNSFYLTHNFNKNYNVAGWIFLDYRNNVYNDDKNMIIYGHNSKNGSMFGTLKNVLNRSWQENKNNHKIVFVTEKQEYEYEVFSTYNVEPEEYYITTNFKNDNEFSEFIKTIKSRSNYNYNTNVTNNDKILTLSSCYGKQRVVLHAKLIKK